MAGFLIPEYQNEKSRHVSLEQYAEKEEGIGQLLPLYDFLQETVAFISAMCTRMAEINATFVFSLFISVPLCLCGNDFFSCFPVVLGASGKLQRDCAR